MHYSLHDTYLQLIYGNTNAILNKDIVHSFRPPMKKLLPALLLLNMFSCSAMDSVPLVKNAPPDYEESIARAKDILTQENANKIYECLLVFGDLLKEHSKELVDADAIEVLERAFALATIKGLLHAIRKRWVTVELSSETINEERIRFCVEHHKKWVETICASLSDIPALEITSCIEILNNLIDGIETFFKQFAIIYTLKDAWRSYLARVDHVDPACLDHLEQLDTKVTTILELVEAAALGQEQVSLFQLALIMKNTIRKEGTQYLTEANNATKCNKQLAPEAEEPIESILGNARQVITQVSDMGALWMKQLIAKRNILRRQWATVVLEQNNPGSSTHQTCISSLQLLIKQLTDQEHSALITSAAHLKMMVSTRERAEHSVAQAKQELASAIIYSENNQYSEVHSKTFNFPEYTAALKKEAKEHVEEENQRLTDHQQREVLLTNKLKELEEEHDSIHKDLEAAKDLLRRLRNAPGPLQKKTHCIIA